MEPTPVREQLKHIHELLAKSTVLHHGFLGGSLGLLYYYYHAAQVLEDEILYDKAEALLEQVFDAVNNDQGLLSGYAYSDGAAGLAYVVNNLQQNDLLDFDIDTEFAGLDRYIYDAAMERISRNEVDYLHGAMGAFHYFSSRVQTPLINQYLNGLFTAFCDTAIRHPDGICFLNYSLERLSGSKIDLGLAHGLSGFLLLIIAAWQHLADKEKAEQIIRDGIAFILRQELPVQPSEGKYSFFPFSTDIEQRQSNNSGRMGWCYGDLNMTLLLYRAGKLLGSVEYIKIADRIGLQSTLRKTGAATQCSDTHFCHGSAGLAQYYKCLYSETGNPVYQEAYQHWLTTTVAIIDGELAAKKYALNPISILDGWTGVAFVLLDHIAPRPLDWAKAFLL